MGQDQAMGFLTLCSLSATKHEIIFISISSVPLRGGGSTRLLSLVPGDCLMKLKE